jgi:hypothetical protein
MHLSGVGVKEINECDVVRPFESLPDDLRLKSIYLNLDAIIRNHFQVNSGNGSGQLPYASFGFKKLHLV